MVKKLKKKLFPTPTAPRSLEDIKNEFSHTQFSLGQQQYLANFHSKAASDLIQRMSELDQEAKARQELDAKIAAAAQPKGEQETPA